MMIATNLENVIQVNTITLMGSRLGPILTASGGVECIEVE
jgi:hypothetical protein